MSVLDEILERKREEARALAREPGEAALRAQAVEAPAPRDFAAALRVGTPPRVIAEFKRRSPSKGDIRADADAAEIAAGYERAGAAALSVLTDGPSFGGSLGDLREARGACALPVLRKDFTVDTLQLYEARAAGADAILLIVAALADPVLHDLHATATGLGMAALVEVHDAAELERAHAVGAEVIGINNRDLHTFKTDTAVTRSLLASTAGTTVVSESGLNDAAELASLSTAGVDAFLVGEALMREPDPGTALRVLRGAR